MLPVTVFCQVNLGWNHFTFWPSSQVCSHRRSEKEARCRNWLYYWEPESLASGGRKRKTRVFSGDPLSVTGLYVSCPCCMPLLRVHVKYTEGCGLVGMPYQPWFPALQGPASPLEPGELCACRVPLVLKPFISGGYLGRMPLSKQADGL